jgi:hypothetical protein
MLIAAVAAGGWSASAQVPATRDAARLVNPIPSTTQSRAAGRLLYQRLCRACHHASGTGKGPYGIARGITPSDFTDARWDFGSSDGEIFAAIRDGMASQQLAEAARKPAVGGPSLDHAYGGRVSDDDIWNLVNHLRTFAPGSARSSSATVP